MHRIAKGLLRKSVLFVVPTLILCVAMLEIGLRLIGRLPSNVTDGIFEQHGNSYRLRRNMTKVSRTPSFACTIHTNSLGFRDASPGPRTVGSAPYFAWVGDSITFANGVEYEQSFVGIFEAAARHRGMDAVNLAVGGHRFTDQEEVLQDFLDTAPRKPAAVVVVFTAQGIATFEQRYGDVFVKDGYIFPRDGWLLPYVTVTLGNVSSAYSFFRDGIRRAQAMLVQVGPNAAQEALELFSRNGPFSSPETAARFDARLERLATRIRAAGAIPIYVYMPSSIDLRWKDVLAGGERTAGRYDLDIYHRLLRRHADRAGIRLVDLRPSLQAAHDRGVRLSFTQDSHYNTAANQLIAAALREAILDTQSPGATTSPDRRGPLAGAPR